jgi:hypothetical protein
MSSQTPASKSQIRAAALLSLSIDRYDYTAAGAALEAAGVRADAIPAGLTWRTAGKLSDAELLVALGASAATDSASASLAARESGAATWAGFKRQVRLERRAAGQSVRDPRDEEAIDFDTPMPAPVYGVGAEDA